MSDNRLNVRENMSLGSTSALPVIGRIKIINSRWFGYIGPMFFVIRLAHKMSNFETAENRTFHVPYRNLCCYVDQGELKSVESKNFCDPFAKKCTLVLR